jgi:glycine/D-amino acid oxidase-like deaminating enzyme
VLLIDERAPLSYTSAQSGNNYRNWWPHPVMTALTNDSIDELERLARESGDVFRMTRGGYALATRRSDITALTAALWGGVEVDVVSGADVHARFPALDASMRHVLHVRRAGDIDGQQLGQYLIEQFAAAGGRQLRAEVTAIEHHRQFRLDTTGARGEARVRAEAIVNAAGPFAHRIAAMLGESLPVINVFQQKVAFEDPLGAIARDMPFTIDLDAKILDWTPEEREFLAADPELEWLTRPMPGGTHCRPEGGPRSRWVKLGWAWNTRPSEPRQDLASDPGLDDQFLEIAMRGAAAFLPALRPYVEAPPGRFVHYGGYYTMTEENWPLIGPAGPDGAFMIAALSGFGSMAACAAGRLCAAWVTGAPLPSYANDLSLRRYDDARLIAALRDSPTKGLL